MKIGYLFYKEIHLIAVAAQLCVPGERSRGPGGNAPCIACKQGHYSSAPGSSTCTKCGTGEFALGTGNVSIDCYSV